MLCLIFLKKSIFQGQTFKITTKRADKTYFLDTNELNHAFGAHILQNVPDLKVDVKNPDIKLQIEIRTEAAYISCRNDLWCWWTSSWFKWEGNADAFRWN